MLEEMNRGNRELVLEVAKQSMCTPSIIAGIPAYNEERTIAEVILKAGCHVGKVLVCDDGSKDLTRIIAKKNGADVLEHKKNKGYGATMQTLLRKAKELKADVLVVFDGDGQHDPTEIPELIKPILEGRADIVIGSRFMKGAKMIIPLYRRIGIFIITLLTRIASGYPISDAQSGFRSYSSRALQKLNITDDGWSSSIELFFRAHNMGLKVAEVPVYCSYEDYPKASKHDPLRQGISIVVSIINHAMHEGIHL
jgi:glycosyltransferase involved in cell wall biosynthesis